MNAYTPTLVNAGETLILLGFGVSTCSICRRAMVDARSDYLKLCETKWGSAFDGGNTIAAQCQRGGFCLRSDIQDKYYQFICGDCAVAGKATFVCAHCHNERKTNEIKESVGEPPERLCLTCFKTVTAEVWLNKLEELTEEHRYDYDR